jgi:CheY-like chemotaxis protein
MKVLIVDDSPEVRRMIKRFLRDQVDEFVERDDGSQACDLYKQHDPDFVLMDITMKEMDGLEATKRIRAAFPEAQVVIVSQWDRTELRKRAKEAGASAYITKANLLPLRDFLRSDLAKEDFEN